MLQSEREKQIYKVIEEHPGISFRALMRKTGIWQGSLTPILTHLKSRKFISEKREGQYRCFWLTSKGYKRLAGLAGPTTAFLGFLKDTKEGKRLLERIEGVRAEYEKLKTELLGLKQNQLRMLEQLGKMDLEKYRQFELDKKLGHIYVGERKHRRLKKA